ncbi:hypothetical protein KVH27_19300 [Streptomyces olivaceus]|uniref:hypothetical protein n=1 Tax=Streptomyces olivaceus TaxID=47716 RepID=UPI001CCFBCCA|nr:hypothetical protein [Streptomyces olivaceus]MBZ6250514.1 hypothetical protein [Streptomyces olivaceus]
MSAPSAVAATLASLLDAAPSWLPLVDHWEIAEDTDTWTLSGQLAGDPSEVEAFRLLAPVMERASAAHSDDGRLVKVPFEWDGVLGQVWYLRPVKRWVVPERCASCPTLLADVGAQFVRLGAGPGVPVICVPCRDRMHEGWVREAAVRELGALPMPAGPEPRTEALRDATEQIARLESDLGEATARGVGLEEQLADQQRAVEYFADQSGRRKARITELEALAGQATEFRVWEPGYGLYVRRAPGVDGSGFAILEARRTDKGRRAWTTAGWQYSAVLAGEELFCWPDAQTAVAEARRVMPGAEVRGAGEAACCHLHKPDCCDPEDCGPCCMRCPTCPTLARQRADEAGEGS